MKQSRLTHQPRQLFFFLSLFVTFIYIYIHTMGNVHVNIHILNAYLSVICIFFCLHILMTLKRILKVLPDFKTKRYELFFSYFGMLNTFNSEVINYIHNNICVFIRFYFCFHLF
jgi:hypothetical protein